jgi:hypothetical protein
MPAKNKTISMAAPYKRDEYRAVKEGAMSAIFNKTFDAAMRISYGSLPPSKPRRKSMAKNKSTKYNNGYKRPEEGLGSALIRATAGDTVNTRNRLGRLANRLDELAREALAYEREAFEDDTDVNGADLVEFFGEWRQRVQKLLGKKA